MICFTMVGFVHLLPVLIFGILINAGGRSLQQPAISALVSKFSSRREQGAVFGVYHGFMSLARIVGPIIAGVVYERHMTGPYVTAGAMVIVATLWTVGVRMTAREKAEVQEPVPA
jgi:MFS family permease